MSPKLDIGPDPDWGGGVSSPGDSRIVLPTNTLIVIIRPAVLKQSAMCHFIQKQHEAAKLHKYNCVIMKFGCFPLVLAYSTGWTSFSVATFMYSLTVGLAWFPHE